MSKTAIITGSAGGLGKGIAERLANDGFNVYYKILMKHFY